MSDSYIYSGNVIDIEASGMGRDSYPIEIAMVTHTGLFYQSLILPDETWTHWSKQAECVHGISQESIKSMGVSVKRVCEDINRLFKDEVFYSDCWSLDTKWLSTLFQAAKMTPRFLVCSTDYILSDEEIDRWSSAKRHYAKLKGVKAHRALADAFMIKDLLDEKKSVHSAR